MKGEFKASIAPGRIGCSSAEGPTIAHLVRTHRDSANNRIVADRTALAEDLERARARFHRLLSSMSEDDWGKASRGTRWTNEQLLFHMVFGYMVVQRLLTLVRVFGRLPDRVGRGFARTLDTVTVPFHAINYHGSCAAARYYHRGRMGAKMDRVIDALQRSLAHEHDSDFTRGMHYPTRWDPFFQDYMTLEDVYRYPGRHFDFHERQISADIDG